MNLFNSKLTLSAFLAVGAFILPLQAPAQDWVGATGDWNTGSNWSSNDVPASDGTATFGNTGTTSVTFSASTGIGTIAFTPTTQAYTFTLSGQSLGLTGDGITGTSSNRPTFSVTSGALSFQNSAEAGEAIIVNNLNGQTQFSNSSSAGTAQITNNPGGATLFYDNSTAGSANIQTAGTTTYFSGNSTAGSATLTNTFNQNIGGALFYGNATAGNATIYNTGGYTAFEGTATAGSATITNNLDSSNNIGYTDFESTDAGTATIINENGAGTYFHGTATGDHVQITNENGGYITLNGTSDLQNAQIANTNGTSIFEDTTTAGQATITNTQGGSAQFEASSNAGSASITNKNGTTAFSSTASASTATITNDNKGTTVFTDTSTAANSNITNKNTGTTVFESSGTAESAAITNQTGGTTTFKNTSTAANATINNKANSSTTFTNHSVASDAVITNQANGTTYFKGRSSGETASIVNKAGGALDISGLKTAGTTLGTVDGAGNVYLGGKNLTLLGRKDNAAPVISGVISDGGTAGGTGGSLTLDSADSLTLSGNNTFSGGTTVELGTLKVGSSTALGTGDLTVLGGTIRVSGNSTPTDLNVAGDYTQSGGTLRLGIYGGATGDNDTLVVGGNTVTFGSGSTLKLGFPGGVTTVASNTTYDLVHDADGGITGEFGTVQGLKDFSLAPGQFATLAYTSTDVTLYFRQYLGITPGLTPNQQSVANYIDTLEPTVFTGKIGDLINNIYPLTSNAASLGSALDQLSPQSLQIYSQIAFNNATFNNQQLNNHLANLRDGLTGFDGSQMTYSDASMAPLLSSIQSRLLAWSPASTPGLLSDTSSPLLGGVNMTEPKDLKSVVNPEPVDPWSTFVSGNVILADINHSADIAHQDYTTGSVTLGADYRIDRHFTAGALLAYGHTDADTDHIGSQLTVDSYSPGLFASYVDGGWYGNAMASYGYNSYTSDRNVSIGAISGDNHGATQGNQYNGNLTGGYEFQRGGWKFGPTASVQYVNLGIDSFNESGPTALNISHQNAESFRSQFGIEARYAMRVGSLFLTPHLSASWQHEFLDDSRGITGQFDGVGPGSFTVQTDQPDRDSAFIDAGINVDLNQTITLFADYETEAGGDRFFGESVQAGVKVGF